MGKELSLNILEIAKKVKKLEDRGVGTAEDTTYDNTDSGLNADTVQGAVDELAESYPADKVMMSDGVTSVEDVLDELTEDTGWTQIGTSDYYYRKVGKVVWVQGSVANTSGSWTTPANLPSGYRPTFNLFETILVNENSFVSIELNKNGNIETISTFSSGSVGFMKSFLTD